MRICDIEFLPFKDGGLVPRLSLWGAYKRVVIANDDGKYTLYLVRTDAVIDHDGWARRACDGAAIPSEDVVEVFGENIPLDELTAQCVLNELLAWVT